MSRSIARESAETRRAFRAGVKGLPFAAVPGPWAEFHVQTDMAQGVNERQIGAPALSLRSARRL